MSRRFSFWSQAHARSARIRRRVAGGCGSLVVAAVVIATCAAGPAGAKVITDPVNHRTVSISPTVNQPRQSPVGRSCTTSCSPLSYHSPGPVQHAERVYAFFWTPSGHAVPSAYRLGLKAFLDQVAANSYKPSNPLGVTEQYFDVSGPSGAKNFAAYNVSDGGVLIDTNPYPANGCTDTDADGNPIPRCLTDAQIQSELSTFVAAHGLPKGPAVNYFVFTPVNVGSCFDSNSGTCSYTGYCGYHSVSGSGSSEMLYADMPWNNVSGCDTDQAFGTGSANSDALDPEVGVWSHELAEMITDPNLNAWFDSGGNEIGDKCAFNYGSGFGTVAGLPNNGLGFWNVAFGTDQYLLQTEFDNRLANCFLTNTDTQPKVSLSITPNPPVHGTNTKFTATITGDTATPFSVAWNFGDGVTTTGTATTINHTYAAAGTITMSVLVTDAHGNTKKVSKTLTVG